VRACFSCAGAATAVTLIWQLLVRDNPPTQRAGSGAAQPGAAATKAVPAAAAASSIAWGIFKLRSVQGICGTWLCCVFASVAMLQMAPTVLMNRFGLTVAEAGRYIALGFSITVPGMFLTGTAAGPGCFPGTASSPCIR
jgi:hypothetical protein